MENKTILLNETHLSNLVRRIISEVKNESMTQEAINFIEYMRRSLNRIYGKSSRGLIDDNINKYIRLIDQHTLKDAVDMFKSKFDTFDPRKIDKSNEDLPTINRPDDWKQKAQADFEKYYNDIKKSSNKLNDPYYESKKIDSNINYMLVEYFKRVKGII